MDKQEGLSTNKDPIFDDSNYSFWKMRMKVCLQSLGMDVWKSIENIYKFPKVADVAEENGDESEENRENIAPRIITVDPEKKNMNGMK